MSIQILYCDLTCSQKFNTYNSGPQDFVSASGFLFNGLIFHPSSFYFNYFGPGPFYNGLLMRLIDMQRQSIMMEVHLGGAIGNPLHCQDSWYSLPSFYTWE